MTHPSFIRLRFAFKLSFAIVAALFLGFHLQLETPRWSVLTAAIVSAGPAFAAGGEPFSGAIRHRGWLRIIGTFIGCIGGLIIIVLTIRAPVLTLMLCCLWAGICTWISSLVRVENSYAFGLAGYTALIIIVTTGETPLLTPQFAVERCSEIVLGIVCAVMADLLFSPRSIKQDIDRLVDKVLVDQYQLLQLCIQPAEKNEIDRAWNELVKNTTSLNGMRSYLMMESSRWQRCNHRLRALHTESLALITQACETYLVMTNHPEVISAELKTMLCEPAQTPAEIHQQMKKLRQFIAASHSEAIPHTISSWVGAATRYLLLSKGVHTNSSISQVEEDILAGDTPVKPISAEGHHAMINGLRTGIATAIGGLFWLWTGWTSGAGCMVMVAVVTSLAMRTPNPRRMALDFLVGVIIALPIGALYFMFIIPSTQQSMLLLCISLGVLAFIIGIEVQKRRLGSLGTLASTINIIVLSNPMIFNVRQFLDSALGQIVGCFVSLIVLLLIRDNAKDRTGRTLLNRFVYSAVSALTTNKTKRRENHLPALYQQLNQLLMMFPADIDKYRLALTLIIAHQRLNRTEIPVNVELSAFHKQIRSTAERVITVNNDQKRRYYFARLLQELDQYQQKLVDYQAADAVIRPVKRLAEMLRKYQSALI
ncbi:p-hydroxybenzoic acid efflux pump subunit AaeB [Yersinia similis]|uniref:p-hydroxybenzoic acid efflux pump subunit AaeB n=1 Tax=Yersinia similis TaxID=367190 RepID=A0A0T9Q8L5_9GAMM|nr:p-hydroxybenzoic acid efflux pump subunit AaeB [Yersinia similis]AHK18815.1 p-hydroxybenzoic acid efflux subunit AaeB [Yersinia similis]CFQ57387.1 p-hydroxybenzoic acid efflux subunit AaeB [Yersinia similis]CNC15405.1 p-hydroxybenzoic acid efflux subunit AaeB [Yersinia similis]CNE83629.1 p-hydroxybenzoic acid efflux subunit AaeB [Yersinia similis]CNF90617.1 p-hydroxybenzoic acid efflux subunit AaeB [Yersinia similis]